jgi:hypothetical protein
MTSATVTIPNVELHITIEQLIAAVNQLEPSEQSKVARALADSKLDAELSNLIAELYTQPEVPEISDQDILDEVRAVRSA